MKAKTIELTPIFKSAVGLDVHQAKITACAIVEQEDGTHEVIFKEFGGFKKDRKLLAQWLSSLHPEVVVMESTGIYWKSPFAALEKVGIVALVVNARHVKQVPGRKTDINDAQWLAMLARSGLLNGSFIPPSTLRTARLISRQRQKLVGILSAEKNRLHKVLTDGGIRLSVVLSDINGKSGRAIIEGLLEGKTTAELLQFVDRRVKASNEEIGDALQGELTPSHLFVLNELMEHIKALEIKIRRFDNQLLKELFDYKPAIELLQTMPGIDQIGAAMLIVEMGSDMDAFKSANHLASWTGLCPGNNESAGKRKSGKIRKGNPWIRRILCECAHAAKRTECMFKQKYQALVIRRGTKRALVAIAHKLLKTIFALLKSGECYRDSTINYEELSVKRNAPRWISKLKEFGYMPA